MIELVHKEEIPIEKENLTDEDQKQIALLKKFFPDSISIVLLELQRDIGIQIDFKSIPFVDPDVIKNLEDRGFFTVAEFPCSCKCGSYSLIVQREF